MNNLLPITKKILNVERYAWDTDGIYPYSKGNYIRAGDIEEEVKKMDAALRYTIRFISQDIKNNAMIMNLVEILNGKIDISVVNSNLKS